MIFKKILQPVFEQVFKTVYEADQTYFNLETEDGFNLLQEDGNLIILD
jgi:hypothetical protein